jgi:hypothetical protein
MFNLVIVLMGTFALSLVLIYFIAAHDRRRVKMELGKAKNDVSTETPLMDFREFNRACQDILEGLKLEINEIANPSGDEVVIRAASINPITRVDYLAVGFYLPKSATLETARIVEVSDQIVSERLGKGLIMTTGMIDKAAIVSQPELAALELIDGERLLVLQKEYSFKF